MPTSTFDVEITRRSGSFGPNRWHEVTIGEDTFLVSYVGSGAVTLRATVEYGGTLSLPRKGSEWGITITSTGGGKVTETLWGWHAKKNLEPSTGRHWGFQKARVLYNGYWARWFDKEGELASMAEAFADELAPDGTPPFDSVDRNIKWLLRRYDVGGYRDFRNNNEPELSIKNKSDGSSWCALPVEGELHMYDETLRAVLSFEGVRSRLFEMFGGNRIFF